MGIRIIVDSASDIEVELALENDITVIPMKTRFGNEEYSEGVTLSREQFYEKLVETSDFPQTSQITPFEFNEVFSRIDPNDQAVVITLSSKLSGTYSSACTAAQAYADRVFVVDSENVTVGERVLINRAIELRAEGKTAREIVAQLEVEKQQVCVVAVLDTLEYLKKGGRISAAAALAGGLLSIKPVVGVVDGEVVILGKARGSKQGNNLLREKIKETGIDFSRPVYLGYTGFSDKLLCKYIKDSRELFEGYLDDLPYCIVGSTIGTHVGPDAIAVAYFKTDK